MKLFSPTRLFRKSAVVTLALWLAGAGCLLGCESIATATPGEHHNLSSSSKQSSTLVVEADACASTEGHGCCKKKSRAARRQPSAAPAAEMHAAADRDLTSRKLTESTTSGMKACPLAISRALSVAKIGDSQKSAILASYYVLPSVAGREQKLALSTLSPLPNRGHTYLHCCSFLI